MRQPPPIPDPNYTFEDDQYGRPQMVHRYEPPMAWRADPIGRDPWSGGAISSADSSRFGILERPGASAREQLAAARERLLSRRATEADLIDLSNDPIYGPAVREINGRIDLANQQHDEELRIELAELRGRPIVERDATIRAAIERSGGRSQSQVVDLANLQSRRDEQWAEEFLTALASEGN
ncbi:MAG: hypothetical protein ACRDVW_00980 [Acidimicrobiales bacterium]